MGGGLTTVDEGDCLTMGVEVNFLAETGDDDGDNEVPFVTVGRALVGGLLSCDVLTVRNSFGDDTRDVLIAVFVEFIGSFDFWSSVILPLFEGLLDAVMLAVSLNATCCIFCCCRVCDCGCCCILFKAVAGATAAWADIFGNGETTCGDSTKTLVFCGVASVRETLGSSERRTTFDVPVFACELERFC